MKYSWAKVGAKVVCTGDEGAAWINRQTGEAFDGPQEGEILVIWGVLSCDDDVVRLSFQKWNPFLGAPHYWNIECFRPLTEDLSRTQSQVDKLKRLTAQSPISVKGVEA